MELRSYEVCRYAQQCPHNQDLSKGSSCRGADEDRANKFFCSLVYLNGIFAKLEKKILQKSLKKIKINNKS